MTATPEESADFGALDGFDYGDGGYSFDLVSFENKKDSSHQDHSYMLLYLEEYLYFDSFEEYVEFFIEDALYFDSYYRRNLVENGTIEMGGQLFRKLSIEAVDLEDSRWTFVEDYYITPVGQEEDCLYLVIYINYWPDSHLSVSAAEYMLKNCFSLGKPVPSMGGAQSGMI